MGGAESSDSTQFYKWIKFEELRWEKKLRIRSGVFHAGQKTGYRAKKSPSPVHCFPGHGPSKDWGQHNLSPIRQPAVPISGCQASRNPSQPCSANLRAIRIFRRHLRPFHVEPLIFLTTKGVTVGMLIQSRSTFKFSTSIEVKNPKAF